MNMFPIMYHAPGILAIPKLQHSTHAETFSKDRRLTLTGVGLNLAQNRQHVMVR